MALVKMRWRGRKARHEIPPSPSKTSETTIKMSNTRSFNSSWNKFYMENYEARSCVNFQVHWWWFPFTLKSNLGDGLFPYCLPLPRPLSLIKSPWDTWIPNGYGLKFCDNCHWRILNEKEGLLHMEYFCIVLKWICLDFIILVLDVRS